MSGIEGLPLLGVVDYFLFGCSLVGALAIGIYFAVAGRRDESRELIVAHDLSALPVVLSLVASFLSGILILGEFPAIVI